MFIEPYYLERLEKAEKRRRQVERVFDAGDSCVLPEGDCVLSAELGLVRDAMAIPSAIRGSAGPHGRRGRGRANSQSSQGSLAADAESKDEDTNGSKGKEDHHWLNAIGLPRTPNIWTIHNFLTEVTSKCDLP